MALLRFHFEISGNLDNEQHPEKIPLILIIVSVLNCDNSWGKFFNFEQFENRLLILLMLLVNQFEIIGIDNNEEHPEKAPAIL